LTLTDLEDTLRVNTKREIQQIQTQFIYQLQHHHQHQQWKSVYREKSNSIIVSRICASVFWYYYHIDPLCVHGHGQFK